MLIAVTELGQAYEVGNEAVVRQLQDGGLVMEKSWVTVNDDRVSDGCRDNQAAAPASWLPLHLSVPKEAR